jgi:hypothetical protein
MANSALEERAKMASVCPAVLRMVAPPAKCVAPLGNAISPLKPVLGVAPLARCALTDNVALIQMANAMARANGAYARRLVALLDAPFVNLAPMANVPMMMPRSASVEPARLELANAAQRARARFQMCVKMASVSWAARSCFVIWPTNASVPYLCKIYAVELHVLVSANCISIPRRAARMPWSS